MTETDSGELYRPVNGTEEVELPIYSSSQSVEITNDYLMRPLSVTKMVTTVPGTSVPEGQTFTMTVKVNGEALSEKAYTLTEQGTVVGNYRTDVNGQFQLKNGQTAIFQEAGRLGDSFEVTENAGCEVSPDISGIPEAPYRGNWKGKEAR